MGRHLEKERKQSSGVVAGVAVGHRRPGTDVAGVLWGGGGNCPSPALARILSCGEEVVIFDIYNTEQYIQHYYLNGSLI